MTKLKVGDEDVGKRLDVFVAQKMPELSRSFIKRLCDTDKIEVNNIVGVAKQKMKVNDSVSVIFDIKTLEDIPKIDLPILYEDDDCIVIDKPAGLLTHSKGAFNLEPTVATFLADRIKDMAGNRAGIVHRLDRATSGVMICAKTPQALTWLQKQFSIRKVKKTYIAIIEGRLDPAAAIIDMPIERHPARPKIFRVGENGKTASTEYRTKKTANGLSMLKLMPKTGRTHQLRVHLKQLGHPILGDFLYDGKEADRLYLHALSLEITLPNHSRQVFNTTLPGEFNDLLK